jgi:hypothetical protein
MLYGSLVTTTTSSKRLWTLVRYRTKSLTYHLHTSLHKNHVLSRPRHITSPPRVGRDLLSCTVLSTYGVLSSDFTTSCAVEVALKGRFYFRYASYAAASYPEEQVTLCENTVETSITLPSGKGEIYTILV